MEIEIGPEYGRRLVAAWCRVHPDQIEWLAETSDVERVEAVVLMIVDKWLLENPYVQR